MRPLSRPLCRPRQSPGVRAAGIAAGFLLDRIFADPRRLHPVAGFGQIAALAEGRLLDGTRSDRARSPGRQRAAGALYNAGLVGGASALVTIVGRAASRSAAISVLWHAVVVWSCLGGSSLLAVGKTQGQLLQRGDHAGSRELLSWLCGRDPDALDPTGLARAVVESLAENTSDAAVGTLFWAAVAGPPGAAAHRAANTLDAMVGHRSSRYQHFGWASARLDDVLGYLPARLAGALAVAAAPTVEGSAPGALRVWLRDARAHPSPNAGVVEATCAGALGIQLGGPTPYPYGVQDRAVLGDGKQVRPGDVDRAVRLHDRVQLAAAMLAVAGVLVLTDARTVAEARHE